MLSTLCVSKLLMSNVCNLEQELNIADMVVTLEVLKWLKSNEVISLRLQNI